MDILFSIVYCIVYNAVHQLSVYHKTNKDSVYQKHSGPLILCVLVGGGRLIFGLNSEFVGGPIFHHNSKFVGPSHVFSNLCVFRGGLIFLPSSALVGPLIFIPNSDLTEPLIFIPIL